MPDKQPEPKQYPTADDHGYCPLGNLIVSAPEGVLQFKRPPCDPVNCQLGIEEEKHCSFKDMAATSNAIYMTSGNLELHRAQLRQLLKEIGDSLSSILQTLAGTQQALPKLLTYLQELPLIEGFVSIEHMLKHIHHDLERAYPPAEAPEGP